MHAIEASPIPLAWWQTAWERLRWTELDDVARLAAVIREVIGSGTSTAGRAQDLATADRAILYLGEYFRRDRHDRYDELRRLWRIHAPDTLAPELRAGIPNRLWAYLLRQLGVSPATTERCWLGKHARDQHDVPQGAITGPWIEWWGHPDAPGAGYDYRLWSWGAVQSRPGMDTGDLGALSPRLAWRPGTNVWIVHPLLAREVAARASPGLAPRLGDGPGFLLACIVDAIVELTGSSTYTPRDLAVLWGTMLLPLLAPSVELAAAHAPPDSHVHGEPDYMQTLPFYLMHPRAQRTIMALDHVCTLLLAEDHASLDALMTALARPGADDVTAPAFDLVRDIARRMHHRDAARSWDSGFGFRLLRGLLRDITARDEPAGFAALWDQAVHGPQPNLAGDASVGALAARLRLALCTALCFPGRPPYPRGPAAQEILDLVWLRWTDESFLL